MRRILSLMAMLVLSSSAWGNLNIIDDLEKDQRLPKPAKNPTSGAIVKVELEEGYIYDRVLASYNRTEGNGTSLSRSSMKKILYL